MCVLLRAGINCPEHSAAADVNTAATLYCLLPDLLHQTGMPRLSLRLPWTVHSMCVSMSQTCVNCLCPAGRLVLSSWARRACGNNGFNCVPWGPYAYLSGASQRAV